jgi:hypothetical protein
MEAMNKKAQQGTPDLPMKTMKTAQSQWFEPVVTAEKRTLQLFCFPYA